MKFDQKSSAARSAPKSTAAARYFVHNRVESIFSIAGLAALVPEARVVVGHGQMDEEILERAMLDFVAKVRRLATTIVENGLDIPNANTIIINRADPLRPVAALPAARPRRAIGSSGLCLLLFRRKTICPRSRSGWPIKEFSDLGSGFRVAAWTSRFAAPAACSAASRGPDRHGRLRDVYEAARADRPRAQGRRLEDDVRATVNLRVDLKIDASYVADMNQRLMLYRKVAAARRGDRPRPGRGGGSVWPAARLGAQPRRLRPDPRHGGYARNRQHRPRTGSSS